QIGALVQQLQELVQLAKGSNSRNGRSSILTELERSQLIAVLETALALLRSPMVEVGFLRRLTGWLGRIGQRAAQREAETALGIAANRAWDLMMGLLRTLT
ncbi:MAG: hypothetical protein K8F58_15125, partial [Bauldia sp.]|nr:hypothetical protein [Bauldia sp.]